MMTTYILLSPQGTRLGSVLAVSFEHVYHVLRGPLQIQQHLWACCP